MVVSSDIQWKYDRNGDVLYLMVGPMAETYEVEDPQCEGLHLRHAIKDNSIVGAIILWFSLQDRDELRRRLPFDFDPSIVH